MLKKLGNDLFQTLNSLINNFQVQDLYFLNFNQNHTELEEPD